ncbi:hypothetical protein SAMN05421833_1284 [Microbispora rosea]|uniref:Membrane-associated oxidoreductase n=1 Tax=Microbispora rosea TaxID=58117 RepID=A0A1N7GDL0_9ACTN|nr:hypothetical protein [Microbispora rosea]GIH50605.1 hypothetical protein Mro03_57840 [Microbispora rosea subsp. rosea]SIS10654.1 hypothetical protein SAMN05421833_1284 [Microbispora rosea]
MRVEDLSEAERRVWEAFPLGEEVDFTVEKPDEDNPAGGAGWGPERTIRARVIAALLMRDETPQSHRVPAIRIKGARITERVELAYSTVRHSARFLSCYFERDPSLYWTRCPQVSFNGSHLPGLSASNAQVDGHLRLDRCFFTGLVELRGTQLAGALTLSKATTSVTGLAIDCDRLQAGRGIMAVGLNTVGQVRFSNVKVSGTVIMNYARLTAEGKALNLDGMVADGAVLCKRMMIAGMISSRNTHVTGPYTFKGTTIDHPGKMAFHGSRITAEGGLYFGGGFKAVGTMRLSHSRIDRELNLEGARLSYPGGDALQAEELQVEGTVSAHGLTVKGRVELTQARIAGSLNLDSAKLDATNTSGAGDTPPTALDGDGVSIGGGLSCTDGFRAEGAVRLADARIGTFADFTGARLRNPDGQALDAAGANIGRGLQCGGFTADGELTLIGASIGRHLYLNDATLRAPSGRALAAWQLEVRELYLRPRQKPEGIIDLRHARIGVLRDAKETWSPRRQDGLAYEALDPTLPAAERLVWLTDDGDGYVPQPYEQLAATYRRLGQDADARTILLAKQRKRRATLPVYARAWGLLQDVTVGYGYRPARAALWLLTLLVAGVIVFTLNAPPRAQPGQGPAFNAVIYSLDLLFPLIDFGQEKAFQPVAAGQWVAYGLVVAGWIFATTIATGISRALSRQ